MVDRGWIDMSETVGGRYALDGRLGEGGMGCVYRARHLQLGKAFALKLISPAFALDGTARARFNQEAKLASEISHPNIVSVVDFGEDAAFGAYMVMELVEGTPLVDGHQARMSIRRASPQSSSSRFRVKAAFTSRHRNSCAGCARCATSTASC